MPEHGPRVGERRGPYPSSLIPLKTLDFPKNLQKTKKRLSQHLTPSILISNSDVLAQRASLSLHGSTACVGTKIPRGLTVDYAFQKSKKRMSTQTITNEWIGILLWTGKCSIP